MPNTETYCTRCGGLLDPVTRQCIICEDDYLTQDNDDMIFDEDMNDI